jgi:hypothetical protein
MLPQETKNFVFFLVLVYFNKICYLGHFIMYYKKNRPGGRSNYEKQTKQVIINVQTLCQFSRLLFFR